MSAPKLPRFSAIHPETFPVQLSSLLDASLSEIAFLLQQEHFTWDSLMQPLEDIEDAVERLWSPLAHLHAVVNSNALRDCYQNCLPKLSSYSVALGQNVELFHAIQSIDQSGLNEVQKKIIQDNLRDFRLSGVDLSFEKKQRLENIEGRLAELCNQFENNVLDASQAFEVLIEEESRLKGLPPHAIETARENALAKEKTGWLLNLEFPCYLAVITFAEDRKLREMFYEAWVTRASDEGPHAACFDNTDVMNEILALRHEKAVLLDFQNYAEYSLADKMAGHTDDVLAFLEDLAGRAYAQAQTDIQLMEDFAKNECQINTLKPWDLAFMSEKMRQKNYALSEEDVRPYLPADKVLEGLFTVIQRLYGVQLENITDFDSWHPDVLCFKLTGENGLEHGFVYLDLYARQNKRGGAWMDACQGRRRLKDGSLQQPIAMLTCNFAKPAHNQTARLSHDEVITLFHEFGHCLQHLLTEVDYLSASGINGVEWDAVELASQIFENWCWEQDVLHLLSRHIETGEPIPALLYEKMLAARNFQSAMAMMRQLEFSLFDFKIHLQYKPDQPDFIQSTLNAVREQTNIFPAVHYNRFQHSFSHIFSGGYGAGYYSYKWAEVLSSDAYGRFEDEGIFNRQTGHDFQKCILSTGSSITATEAFIAFRGRPAETDALLRHNGIL